MPGGDGVWVIKNEEEPSLPRNSNEQFFASFSGHRTAPPATSQTLCLKDHYKHARTTSNMASDQLSILFVCLGNICRSTMAEGIFRSMVSKAPYQALINEVDSCGTGAYHTGVGEISATVYFLGAIVLF
jgi:hypothetical protein